MDVLTLCVASVWLGVLRVWHSSRRKSYDVKLDEGRNELLITVYSMYIKTHLNIHIRFTLIQNGHFIGFGDVLFFGRFDLWHFCVSK